MVPANVSAAGKLMMAELALDELRLGQVFAVYMLGCAVFLAPLRLLGDRVGGAPSAHSGS